MATGYCKNCIYSKLIKDFVFIPKLPTSPVNLNSITIKALISCNEKKDTLCCGNTNNSPIEFVNGDTQYVPCDILNHYGQCKYFDDGSV